MSLNIGHYQHKGESIMQHIASLQDRDTMLLNSEVTDRLIGNMLILYFISNKITFELLKDDQPTYLQISDAAHAATKKLKESLLYERWSTTQSVSFGEKVTRYSIKDGSMWDIFTADNYSAADGQRKLRIEIHTSIYMMTDPDICMMAGVMVYFLEQLGIKTENLGDKPLK